MLFDLIVKIFLTPENIIGIILNILGIISLCFIFKELNEKWWKSLIPIYNTYILYKNFWKHHCFFILEILFTFINTRCLCLIKKHLIDGIFYTIKYAINNKEFDSNINLIFLIIISLIFLISFFIIFIMKRITYLKICNKFNSNLLIKIGTIIIPDIFLLISVFIYKRKNNIHQY